MNKIRAVYNQQSNTRRPDVGSRAKWANIGSRETLYQLIAVLDEATQLVIREKLLSHSMGAAAPPQSLSDSPMVDSAGPSSFQAPAPVQDEIRRTVVEAVRSGVKKFSRQSGSIPGGQHNSQVQTEDLLLPQVRLADGDMVQPDSDPVIERLCQNSFMKSPSKEVVEAAMAEFIDRTNNLALATGVCAACAREMPVKELTTHTLNSILNPARLRPEESHPHHDLFQDMLLHPPGILNARFAYLCDDCVRALKSDSVPMFALANKLWIGKIPHELAFLTLPERILIGKYFPAAYIFKLFPKKTGAHRWEKSQLYSGLKGNVSTYRLDQSQISSMVDGLILPPISKVLAATIGITFVGPKNLPEKSMPKMFRVRRSRVREALEWLRANNPLYSNISISASRLEQLPENGIPYELMATVKHSSDMNMLYAEQDGYVPPQDISDGEADEEVFTDSDEESMNVDDNEPDLFAEPGVVPLSHLGVVDIDGIDITESELMAHALANCCEVRQDEDYLIRRGSAFVNEYARVDPVTGQRNDGGPSDTNHLLGCFPTLFPYGQGGFEIERPVNVPYEVHVRWALRYEDKHFRKDPHFPFQVFGVCQKRQIRKGSYFENQNLLSAITAEDLTKASQEETRGVPFSNPAVCMLCNHLSAVKTKVQGSDESRKSIRAKIWGTNILHNPPSLWVTINPSDMQDPIAQVFAGAEIDLDAFSKTAGPASVDRALNIASDPYASAKFFHFLIETILEVLFGINKRRNGIVMRKEGVFGVVKSYIGTVEAQGRGSLHLHLLVWLDGAPTAKELIYALTNDIFRGKIKDFIRATIRADLDGRDISAIPPVDAVSYSRPLDPHKPADVKLMKTREVELARTTQLHKCSFSNCLKVVKGQIRCKRRAPFPIAQDDWVDSSGEWGPRRFCGFLNNWNPTLLMTTRANHDVKLFMNGRDTNVLTWYITNYASKKQQRSSNVSALLAKRVAFHSLEEKKRKDVTDVNKRLIQRCANTLTRDREFSGPEIMSYLMGWGDRFESHHYVAIYSDAIISALKSKYPGLRETRCVGASDSVDRDHGQIITMVSGVITMKDQLNEYVFRGDELDGMDFLSFMLETYDGKAEHFDNLQPNRQLATTDTPQRPRGRPPNRRVPYQQGFNKSGRCRIFRTEGHETLPQFAGSWMPRSDRPQDREIYCASILALLKPWKDLSDLKADTESFESSFIFFSENIDKRKRDIIENIQYYYDCYDGAKRHQQEMSMNGAERTIDYEEDAMPEDFMNESIASEPTEEDIAQAYESRGTMRERLYAQVTMNTAIECGVFSEGKADTVFLPTAGRADNEDLKTFIEWGEKLRAAVRNQVNSGGSGLFASDDGKRVLTNDMIEGVEENRGKDVEDEVTRNLKRRVELAVGMKVMVVLNIATEAEIANGTRGTVNGIVLDPREDDTMPDKEGNIHLQYPPSVIYFKPDLEPKIVFDGLPRGIIPISPSLVSFSVDIEGKKVKLERRQLAIVPGYAFTDYKSQGQTLEYIIVDIAKPPSGKLSPFSVYVALSRSRGRKSIRILRDFDPALFMHHPSEDLRQEMARLEQMDINTKHSHDPQGLFSLEYEIQLTCQARDGEGLSVSDDGRV
ncbi:hypothetical protein BYT27DRAFT_7214241 [Phlegmacium glaucopus]|nr:hypothetical protein BYT27DRAFT_7214241 [Phlegmacium glaucopus]